MAATLLPSGLWDVVEPFLPIPPCRPKGGRPRVSDRACLTGIWDLMHFALLDWLARNDQIDWSRAVLDSCSVRAVCAGDKTGPNPTDRAKRGSKRHLICEGRGVPLAVRLTGANRNDSQEALALVDAIPQLQGERGRPRRRPDCVFGDWGYDADAIRRGLRARHIVPWLAMRRTNHGSGLGRWRWVVERTLRGSTSFAACACGMTSGPTSTKRSSPWLFFFFFFFFLKKKILFAVRGSIARISLNTCPCPLVRA